MNLQRVMLIGLATAMGYALAGCLLGVGVGLVAPNLYRSLFRVADGSPFDPVSVGLGLGSVAGFVAGSAIGGIGLVIGLAPGLIRWRPFARGVLQPSLGGLVLVIALVAVGFSSLRDPSRGWVEAWFVLTTVALASATLLAFRASPGRHGFATGFAVFGWSYLILSLMPESRAQLPTCRLLAALEKQISGSWKIGVQHLSLEMGPFPAKVLGSSWEPLVTSRGGLPGTLNIDEVQPEFRRIGHSLFTLMAAVIGGVVADLHRRRRDRPSSSIADEALPAQSPRAHSLA